MTRKPDKDDPVHPAQHLEDRHRLASLGADFHLLSGGLSVLSVRFFAGRGHAPEFGGLGSFFFRLLILASLFNDGLFVGVEGHKDVFEADSGA